MSGHRQKRGGLRKNEGTEIMLFSWQRYVYKFVTYITLCESWWDFDITHVFSLTTQKVIFVTLLCISSREHMCSEVLLAKQRLATHMAFFMIFGVCIIWRLYSLCPRKMCYVWDSVIYIIAGWSAYWVFSTEHAALHWFFSPTLSTTLGWCHEWMFYGVIK